MLMFAPQEHLRAGVVAFILKTAPSLHEEHLNLDHWHHNIIPYPQAKLISTGTHYLQMSAHVQRHKDRN